MAPPQDGSNTPLQLAVTYSDREGKQFRWAGARGCKESSEWSVYVSPGCPHSPAACLLACMRRHLCKPRRPSCATRSSRRTVALPPGFTEAAAAPGTAPLTFYASSGVQKAVLLARYTDLLQTW